MSVTESVTYERRVEKKRAASSAGVGCLPTPPLLTARGFAHHARMLILFYVFPSVFPYGFSSKRETARSLQARLHRRFLSRQLDAIFVASSFKHARNPCDIAATNRTENRTWFTRAILRLQLWRDKNCIELPRQKLPV